MLKKQATAAPRLSVKAAEARYLLPIVHFLMTQWLPCETAHELLRLQSCDALMRVYKEVDNWTTDSPAVVSESGRRFVLLYVQLRESMTTPERYKLTPKFHLFLHLVMDGANPRDTWNYWDESEIGHAAQLAETLNVPTLATKLLGKYRTFEFKRS